MAINLDSKKKKLFLFGGIGVLVIAAVLVILLVTGILTHSWLYRALAADGTATIEINEDITVDEMLVVNGDKTLVGNGTIYAKSGEYAVVINPTAKLTINGPSVDCEDGATNGIYTSEQATFVFDAGTIKNTAGHGVRNLGTNTFEGGNIEEVGTNWLMIDENAATTITAGTFKDADEIGIISGANSTLDMSGKITLDTAVDNLVYAAGTTNINGGTYSGHIDYAFYNSGVMNISNVTMSGAKGLGYVENAKGAKMNLSNVSFLSTKSDYIYNLGVMSADGLTLGDSVNSAIESTGAKASITLKNVTAGELGASFLLNKSGNATLENVKIESVVAYVVRNKAANLNATGLEVGEVGGTAFLNDFVDSKTTTSVGVMNISDFKIGEVAGNGLRSNGGSVTLKNGSFDVCQNHGLYIKDGKMDCDTVTFAGAADTKPVIQIGYKTTLTAVATFENCDITGGARGIQNYATTTITNCKIHDIQSGGSYKAGAALKNAGTMEVTGTTFSGNRALSSGGAVYNTGKLTLGSGNVFTGNSSATSGGAIANGKTGTLKLTGGTISNNKATNYAGGIYNSGTISISGVTVSNNYATKGGGGIENTGSASISGGTFRSNRSGSAGGGIYNGSKGTMTISGVTVSSNTSADGKSAGGVYNLGKMTVRSGSFTGNSAGTYGGAITNGVSSTGAVGNLTIYGGSFNGNTARANGGGALYNRGTCTIAGGNFNGNYINSEKNGKNIYNSGNLTITGGYANDCSEKPYDMYTYKGNVNLSGSPAIGSIYKAADATITVAGALYPSSQIKLYMGSYVFGTKALYGSESNIAAYKSAFDLSHHDVSTTSTSTTKYVDDYGYIQAPYADEVELWRNGEKIATTYFTVAASSLQDGDTIKIIGDVDINKYTSLSCFSSTTIDTHKTINITTDGAKHTVNINTGSDCGFYIAASTGDGGTGTSESGYYRSSVTVNWDATNITFTSSDDMGSAAFYVSGPATLNLTGGTFKGFTNVATEAATEEQTHSTGKNGAAMSIGGSSTVSISGATFENNSNAGSGGAAIYCNGKLTINNCTFNNNKTDEGSAKNGGAIYVTSTGNITVNDSTFTNNFATNGAAIYAYGGKVAVNGCTFSGNSIEGTAAEYGQSIYVTSTTGTDKKYGSLTLNNVTVTGATGDANGVSVRTGCGLSLSGKDEIDTLYVDDTPVDSTNLAEGSKININPATVTSGMKLITGNTEIARNYFTVKNDPTKYVINEDGTLKITTPCCKIGDNEYMTLEEAVTAAQNGDTIVLIDDIEVSTSTSPIIIDKEITLDIDGHKLTSKGNRQMFRVNANGIFTIKDSEGSGSIEPGDGTYAGRAVWVYAGKFTLESGVISGSKSTSSGGAGAVNVAAGAVFEMKGGKITDCSAKYSSGGAGGMAGAVAVSGQFIFSGGEITGNTQEEGHYAIEGTGEFDVSSTALCGDTFNVTTTNLTGGYYKSDVSAYCGENYECVASSTYVGYGYMVKEKEDAKDVAEVDGTGYKTFAAAMSAALAKEKSTIKLLKDVTISTPYTVTNNLTFDLNGCTVTGIGTSTSATAPRFAIVEGTLTIDDTSAAKTGTFTNFGPATKCNGAIWNKGTLNVKAGIFDMNEYKNGAAIYNGATGTEAQKEATVNITGGTFKSATGTVLYAYYGTINVSDGFVSGTMGVGSNGKINLTGGYYSTNTIDPAEGYEYVEDTTYPGYSYRVVSTTKAAEINGTQYATLDDAITAANGMEKATIKLLANIDEFAGATISGNVTIDLAGKTITPAETTATTFTVTGTLTITDTVGGGTLEAGTSAALSGSTINIAAGKIEGEIPAGTNITGGYFTVDVSSLLTSDYKCVADTTYEGYGYKVKAVDAYEQPEGTDGKDITDIDKFDEETTSANPQ